MGRFVRYATLVIVAAAVLGGVIFLRSRPAGQEEQDIRATSVERGTMLVAVSASGRIEPDERVNFAFESSGEVEEVLVDVGDRVAAGDVLARLDTRQLNLQVHQAQAALALAQAQLTQLKEGARPEEIAAAEAEVRAAEAQVAAATADRDQVVSGPGDAQIAAAEAHVASAALQHRITLIAHDRTIKESDDDEAKEQARYDLHAAEVALSAAQTQLDDLLAGVDADAIRAAQANVAAATARRDAARAQLELLMAGPMEEQLTDAQAQVEQAQAALELAELALARATLEAPFDGVVAAVNVTPDEMASAGMPAVALLDTSAFHLMVLVDEIDVGKLVVGQAAQVTLDALPETNLSGRVTRIAPAATIEGGVVYYEVLIDLEETKTPVRADMTANATILVNELADVLMVPTWVVRVDPVTGQAYVNQRAGDEIVRTDIVVGVRHEGMAQITGGLAAGDEVIWVQDAGWFGQ